MILPILSYGHKILREKCRPIDASFSGLNTLIDDMWNTLYQARGCGLAAPQVNHNIRLFIVDSTQTYEEMQERHRRRYFADDDQGIQETFINARLTGMSAKTWIDEEGCLSIPGLHHAIPRAWTITIAYEDRDFKTKCRTFSGLTARMIQHEYDHIEGILYTDRLPALSRKLLQHKLKKISAGNVDAGYRMRFPG